MKQMILEARVDPETYDQAKDIFAGLGLSMDNAINIFLHATVNSNGMPFSIRLNPLEWEHDD